MEEQFAVLTARIEVLEETIGELGLENESLQRDLDMLDVSSAVERCIVDYDFTDIVANSLRTDVLFESGDFECAVKEVIVNSLR
jgi:hypothetical protein